MPIATDPENTFKIVLEGDKGKEPEPGFVYRHLTARQWGKVCDAHQNLEKCKDDQEIIDLVFGVCRIGLVGWENIIEPATGKPMPFEPDRLEDVLAITEATELMVMVRASGILGADCKKKFDLLSASGTARSVKTAKVKRRAKTRRGKGRK